LQVTAVSVTYASSRQGNHRNGSLYALEDISLRVEAGEQIAIVGPNGAGKSTLFKLLAGILKPDSGDIEIFGKAPDKHTCIAYVTQSNLIDWSFPVTVEDVVMMGRTRHIGLFRRPGRRDWAIVHHCLERVQAADLARTQIGELSGGQQQRVFIARALAQDADLLLLDEPLNGLDVPSQEAVFAMLASLRKDGVTVLLTTHDLHLAGERFDRVILLNKRIVAMGAGTAVLTTENLLQAYSA
jgi:manganese/iron transport system ATP-binding protein